MIFKHKKIIRISLICIVVLLVLVNVFSAIQAYSFSHIRDNSFRIDLRTPTIGDLLLCGITGFPMSKPQTRTYPNREYSEVKIPAESGQSRTMWIMHPDSVSQGLVIFFHGYLDEKSGMLDRAYALLDMQYSVMLVDFGGAGASDGRQITLGYNESKDVKLAFDYARGNLKEKDIYLLGFSMGAAAIAKAQSEYKMDVKGIILEASYGKLSDAIGSRVKNFHLPHFPFAQLITFYFGAFNNFNAFSFSPDEFVKEITVPTLIMCGGRDRNIPEEETKRIFDNTAAKNKQLKIFPESIHESYLVKYADQWKLSVSGFLQSE